ncbi:MAG: hypothetical protein V1930_05795 [Pseudomonadota bacterium]
MKSHTILSAALIFMIILGCQPVDLFTDDYRREFDEHLKYVQFYISDEIILRRELEGEEKSVTKRFHSIRIEKTRKILEITIPANTPGIVNRIEKKTLYVQFEPSPDGLDRTIPFRRIEKEEQIGSGPGTGLGHVYQFRGKKIIYGGREYFVYYEKREFPVYEIKEGRPIPSYYIIADSYPVLKINPVEEFQEVEKVRRSVSGLKLGR